MLDLMFADISDAIKWVGIFYSKKKDNKEK